MVDLKIVNVRDMTMKRHDHGNRYTYNECEIVEKTGETDCCVSVYELAPGKSNYPYHYHLKSEEVYYIISGEGVLETPDGERKVFPGDVVFFPSSEKGAHRLSNRSDTMLVYLDVDTVSFPDVAVYPETKKIGIYNPGMESRLYKDGTEVGYYEGE